MPANYTVREKGEGSPTQRPVRTAEVLPYRPSELFADVGEDNASGFTADQVWYSTKSALYDAPYPAYPGGLGGRIGAGARAEYLSSWGGGS